MTTRTYAQVLADIEALAGVDLAAEEEARVGYFINRRARKAYDRCEYWPRFLVAAEERQVTSGGLLVASEAGKSDIDTLLRLHNADPYKTAYTNEYVQWHQTLDGYQITGWASEAYSLATGYAITEVSTLSEDLTAYTISRQVSSTEYDSGTAYPKVTLVYISSWNLRYYSDASETDPPTWTALLADPSDPTSAGGGFYASSGGASGQATVATTSLYGVYATYKKALNTTYSDGSSIPGEWADYIVHGAYSDWLRSEGQQEKAAIAELEAEDYLQDQLEKVSRQNGNNVQTRVITYANTQYRT